MEHLYHCSHCRFWVNGNQTASTTVTQGLGDNTQAAEITLGIRRTYGYLKDKLSCAAFFNRAIGATEVADLIDRCAELECSTRE